MCLYIRYVICKMRLILRFMEIFSILSSFTLALINNILNFNMSLSYYEIYMNLNISSTFYFTFTWLEVTKVDNLENTVMCMLEVSIVTVNPVWFLSTFFLSNLNSFKGKRKLRIKQGWNCSNHIFIWPLWFYFHESAMSW